MKRGLPLYGQVLLLLLANLLLIALMLALLLGRSGGWQVLLSDATRDRLLGIAERLSSELAPLPQSQWPPVLARYGAEYGAQVSLHPVTGGPDDGDDPDDRAADASNHRPPHRLGGEPPPLHNQGSESPPLHDQGSESPPSRKQGGEPPPPHGPPGPHHAHSHSSAPLAPRGNGDRRNLGQLVRLQTQEGRYVLSIPSHIQPPNHSLDQPGQPTDVWLSTSQLRQLLSLLGLSTGLLLLAGGLLFSALLWWPFVWSISRTLRQLTAATQRIAQGQFETHVALHRHDELGQLAQGVNRMARQLQGHATAQRQFVADIAHEVTAPLARLRFGLGLLETQLVSSAHTALADVDADAQQMAQLLEELLVFSRADAAPLASPSTAIQLHQLVREVLGREDPSQQVAVHIPPQLQLHSQAPLLARALANLLRNALRYGVTGVSIHATALASQIEITVSDQGPGVPPEALPHLGQAFYRPHPDRNRDSGGTGLGLAIVLRCIARCGGTVMFENGEEAGFRAVVRLPV